MEAVGFQRTVREAIEKNDCVVTALHIATGMPYFDCHRALHDAGRTVRVRTPWSIVTSVYARHGAMHSCQTTVGDFVRDHPVGTFIVSVRGHVFVIRDGVCLDHTPSKPSRKIGYYWVMHAPQAPAAQPVGGEPKRRMGVAELLAKIQATRIAAPVAVSHE